MAETKFTHAVYNETTQADVSKHVSKAEAETEADRLRRYHSAHHFQVRSTKETEKVVEDNKNPSLGDAPGDGTLKDAPTVDSLTNGAKQAEKVRKESK